MGAEMHGVPLRRWKRRQMQWMIEEMARPVKDM
jgi:hypothetical protein